MTRYTRFPPGSIPLAARTGVPVRTDIPAPDGSTAPARDDRPPTRARTLGAGTVAASRLHPVVLLFLFSLLIPAYFFVGTVRLSPMRVVLLAVAVPVLVSWASGGCGRIRAADLMVMAFSAWMALTFLADGGRSTPEYAVVSMIETVVPYLIARRFVRTEADYDALMRVFFWIAVLLLPGAAIESLTGQRIYNKMVSFLPSFGWSNEEQRLGMFRAQTVFEHPILFGVFMAAMFAPVYAWARLRMPGVRAAVWAAPVVGCTFFSLSAGAYTGFNIQLILMVWGYVLSRVPGRWKLLTALAALAYVVVEVGSNRTAFQVFSSYLAFNSHTSYWRVLIFDYGIQNVWQNPILGLGLRDWARPAFMGTSSVDNFWLLQAMRHGIPGFMLMLATYALCMRQLIASRPHGSAAQRHRDALAFALIGLGISIITVHIWNAAYGFFMFLLGATAWFRDARAPDVAPQPDPQFSPKPGPGDASRAAGRDRRASDPAGRTGAPRRAGIP